MPDSSQRTALYRLYNAEDQLLYAGISQDPSQRFTNHAAKPWWPEVERQEITWYPTHTAARAAEVQAIESENPRHNISNSVAELPPPSAPKTKVRHKQIADDLRSAILEGRHAVGSRIPTEVALMAHYGAARGTVRQALAVLAKEGLTEARLGSGVFVRASRSAPTVQVPVDQPSQAARVLAAHMPRADLVALTQALISEIAH